LADGGGEPLVAAIVVTFNGGAVTRACVESVRASRGVRVVTIVVDNASAGAERSALDRSYAGATDVELVLLGDNRHYAGGVNAGAARALTLGATHLVFMNNDTELEADCLALLVEASRRWSDAGVVGPALLDSRDRRPLSLGERYATWSLALPRTLLRVRSAGAGEPYRVGGIMGSVILVTRECFERVGPYREDILVYYEEVDFCLRARSLGYRPMLVPRAVALHDGMRGFASGLSPYAAYLKCRNAIAIEAAHGGPVDWLAFAPSFAAVVGVSALLYALRGRADVVRALARGIADGLRNRPALLPSSGPSEGSSAAAPGSATDLPPRSGPGADASA
jgi:GT2 family glycosyltransferase